MLKHVVRTLPLVMACSMAPLGAAKAAQEEPNPTPESSQAPESNEGSEATPSPETPPPAAQPRSSSQDPDLEGMPGLGGDPDLEGMPGLGEDPDLEGMPGLGRESKGSSSTVSSSEGAGPSATFRGRFRTLFSQDLADDRAGEDLAESQSSFDLEAALRLTSHVSARVSGRLVYDLRAPERDFGGSARSFFSSELRDAVVSLNWGRVSLDIGQQVVRWGSTDVNSPNDIINPADFRPGQSVDLETPVLPIPLVRAAYAGDLAGGELVFVPFFYPHRGYAFGTDWTLLISQPALLGAMAAQASVFPGRTGVLEEALFSPSPPSYMPRNSSVGGRVFLRGVGWDLRLNLLYGWDRVPEVVLFPPSDPPPPAAFSSKYHRELSVGLDGSAVLDDFVFRLDARFSNKRTFYTQMLMPVRSRALSWAGGVEFRERFLLELYGIWVPGRSAEDPELFIVDRNWANAAFSYRDTFLRDELKVSVGLQYGLSQKDWAVSGSIGYDVRPGHELAVGALILNGPSLSLGGIFKANDYAFARYTYVF